MTTRTLFAAAAAALAIAAAPTAQAAIVTTTYTGTASGADAGGVFGLDATAFAGVAFTARFVFDTELGIPQESVTHQRIYGGSSNHTASPYLSATLTLNDVTYAFDAANERLGGPGFFSTATTHSIENNLLHFPGAEDDRLNIFYVQAGPVPIRLTQSFYLDDDNRPAINNAFHITTDAGVTTGRLDVRTVANGVPEPATWALMIAGFGLAGATLRRRPALT